MNAVKNYTSHRADVLNAGLETMIRALAGASRRLGKNPKPSAKWTAAILLAALSGAAIELRAQTPTPLPQYFHEWTGAVDSNFLNAANWTYSGGSGAPSSSSVPDGPTAAIYLPLSAQNKVLNFTHEGTGTKRFSFFSIQTGASKAYTLNFSGNPNGWLEVNPLIKGFTTNGSLEQISSPGYNGASNNNTRIPVYVTLNAYTRLTLEDSLNTMLRTQSGLNQALFTLRGNAEMDVSNIGTNNNGRRFVETNSNGAAVAYTVPNTAIEIGAIQVTEPGTRIYMGTLQVTLQNNLGPGDNAEWGGLMEWDTTTLVNPADPTSALLSSTRTHSFRGAITRMTGQVNSPGIFWFRGGDTQYVVDGTHNGPLRVGDNNGARLGGSGVVNGNVEVRRGGWINPAQKGTGTGAGQKLTINGNVTLNGGLEFDLVTASNIDNLLINGDLLISAPSASAAPLLSVFLNEDTFLLGPGEYDLMTVNGNITGAFSDVIWSVGPLLSPSWEWVGKTLRVKFVQLPFSGLAATYPELSKTYVTILSRIDAVANSGVIGTELLASLNRAKAQYQFEDILYQLTPNTFQAWYPAAVVRTNSLVQNIQDRELQDAAYRRAKGSMQTFFDGYRQESSRDASALASYSNYGTTATLAGADYAFTENLVAGGFFAYEESDSDLDTAGGESDIESVTFGVKARFTTGKLQYNAMAFYGSDEYKSIRSVQATGLAQWAESDTDGTRYGAAGSVTYTFNMPSWFEVAPTVGVQWLDWQADGFQEHNGDDANLRVFDQGKMSVQSKLGVRIARSIETKYGFIRPFFQYSWLREFYDGTRSIDAELFGGVGGRIGVRVPGIDTDGFRMDCGIDWNATRSLRVNLRYTAEDGGAADESMGVRAGLTYTF
jgi:uncharacterized protein YhjY with autotransporter beta-barrel domain